MAVTHNADPHNAAFAVSWESHAWDRTPSPDSSRRKQLAARGPYQAAVPPLIVNARVPLSSTLQAEAEDAVRAITRFDSEVTAIAARRSVSGEVKDVEVAPLASVLLRTESASSSEIEGVTAGAKALALAAIGDRSGPNAQLVTANVTAMQRAVALSDEISVNAILAAHDALLTGHSYAGPGQLRTQQVWIGSTAASPHTAQFVPPHQSRVPMLMEDVTAFANRGDLPVLVQVAIAHAQFETIHPFNDGNGRTGRVLVHAMLRRSDVTRRLTLPVSAGLLTDTPAYFRALDSYREGRLEPIIEQFTAASFRAVRNGRELVDDLDALYQKWSATLPSRRGSAARRLLPLLLNQPAVHVAYVAASVGVTETAAQRAVDQLESAGILTRTNTGKRNRVWLAPGVIDALDRFAERVKRRN